jgi:hypothetical protein
VSERLELTLPSFRAFPSDPIGLIDILDALPHPRPSQWRLRHFEAAAEVGSTMRLSEIESQINADGSDVRLSTRALAALATGVAQIIDCVIEGHLATKALAADPAVTIEAFDSTEWTIALGPLYTWASASPLRALSPDR